MTEWGSTYSFVSGLASDERSSCQPHRAEHANPSTSRADAVMVVEGTRVLRSAQSWSPSSCRLESCQKRRSASLRPPLPAHMRGRGRKRRKLKSPCAAWYGPRETPQSHEVQGGERERMQIQGGGGDAGGDAGRASSVAPLDARARHRSRRLATEGAYRGWTPVREPSWQ